MAVVFLLLQFAIHVCYLDNCCVAVLPCNHKFYWYHVKVGERERERVGGKEGGSIPRASSSQVHVAREQG